MGVKKGSMSLTRFRLTKGEEATNFDRAEILRRLESVAFREPDTAEGETEGRGLVVFEALLNTDFEAASEKTFVGPYVFCTYRRDRLRIPAAYLRALVAAEEDRAKEREGRTRLGRTERAAIKERVEMMLLKRALPAIATADIVWSLTDNTVRVFAGSAALVEEAAEYFEAAFEVQLLPVEPFVRLLDRGLEPAELERLELPVPVFVPALLSSKRAKTRSGKRSGAPAPN